MLLIYYSLYLHSLKTKRLTIKEGQQMNYTFSKRRELNDAFSAYLLDQDIKKQEGGMPIWWLNELPDRSSMVTSIEQLSSLLPHDDWAWRNVVPVFVRVNRISDKSSGMGFSYLLNYVNCSAPSMERAAELVESGRLFWIPNKTIKSNGKRNG